jgi:hypothetical protein
MIRLSVRDVNSNREQLMPCVRCANCGFFTVYHPESGEYLELDEEYREHGRTSARHTRASDSFFTFTAHVPLCFVDAHDLSSEASGGWTEAAVIAVGHTERDCNEFIRHQRGLSPKEHREMKLLREVESMNRCAQAEMLAAQRADKLEAERLAKERYEDMRDLTQANNRSVSQKAWIALAVSAFALIANVVVSLIRH